MTSTEEPLTTREVASGASDRAEDYTDQPKDADKPQSDDKPEAVITAEVNNDQDRGDSSRQRDETPRDRNTPGI